MIDLLFDIGVNDLVVLNGVFANRTPCGLQNGSIIFNKSCVDITAPQIGVGFEEVYPNISYPNAINLTTVGVRQIKEDGATNAKIEIMPTDEYNNYQVSLYVKYKER